MALVSLLIFGVYQIGAGSRVVGAIEIAAGSILLINVGQFRFMHRISVAHNILIVTVLAVLITLFVTGGIEGTGVYWFFMFPVAVFFLTGTRIGLRWVGALYVISLALLLLARAGLISTPYNLTEARQLYVVLFIISALVYIYEGNRERDARVIADKGAELAAILDNLPVGVVLARVPSGQLMMVNLAGLELLGRGIDPNSGHHQYSQVYDLIKEDGSSYPSENLPLSMTLRTGQTVTKADIVIRRPNGAQIVVRGTSAPVKNASGVMVSAVVVFEDITKEREIDRMKSEFVSVASHQLRTPLTGIKWFGQLLIRGKAGPLTPQQLDFMQQIAVSNDRMIALVEDLLNVSRIETGRKFNIVKKLTDMTTIIDSIFTELVALAASHQVIMKRDATLPSSLTLNVDPDKIRQVLQNLLSNAVKYSKVGGTVTISCDQSKNDQIVFLVKDSGLGIPARQQSRIFEKFFRADNVQTHETDGTGLGLYIAKAIIEGHDGKLWFESVENTGTTFFFSLPKT